jgi:hypothetical protein
MGWISTAYNCYTIQLISVHYHKTISILPRIKEVRLMVSCPSAVGIVPLSWLEALISSWCWLQRTIATWVSQSHQPLRVMQHRCTYVKSYQGPYQ